DIFLDHFGLPDRKLAANIASRLLDCSLYTHVSGPLCDSATAPESNAVIDSNAEIYTLTAEARNALKTVRKGEALQRAKTQTRKKYMGLRGHLLHPLSSDGHNSAHSSSASSDACSNKSGISSQSRVSSNSQLRRPINIVGTSAANKPLPPPLDMSVARSLENGDSDATSQGSKTASPLPHGAGFKSIRQKSRFRRSANSPADTLVSSGPLNTTEPTERETAGSPLQQIDIPDASLDGLLNTWSFISGSAADDHSSSSKGSLPRASVRNSVPSLRVEVSPIPRRVTIPLHIESCDSENDSINVNSNDKQFETDPIDTPICATQTSPSPPEEYVDGPEDEYHMPSENHKMFRDSVSIDWLYNSSSFYRRRWGLVYGDARDQEHNVLCRRSIVCSSPASIHRCPSAPSLSDPLAITSDDSRSYMSTFRDSHRSRPHSTGTHRYSLSLSQYNEGGGWAAETTRHGARDSSRFSDITIASSYIGAQFRGPMDISLQSFNSDSNGQLNTSNNNDNYHHSFDPIPDTQQTGHRVGANRESIVSYSMNPSVRFSANHIQARRRNAAMPSYIAPIQLDYQQSPGDRFSMVEEPAAIEGDMSAMEVGPDHRESLLSLEDEETDNEPSERRVEMLSSDGVDVHRAKRGTKKPTSIPAPAEIFAVASAPNPTTLPGSQDAKGSDDGMSIVGDRASSVTLDSQPDNRPSSVFGPWQQPKQQAQLLSKGRRISISAEPTCTPRTSREAPISRINRASVHSNESGGSTVPGSSVVGGCMQLNLWRNTVSSEFLQSLSQEMIAQQEAIYEIICTEQCYLHDLELIDVVFSKPLLERPEVMQQKQAEKLLGSLFYNYADLIENSKGLVAVLEDRASESSVITRIADIFDEWANDLTAFIEYSVHVPIAQHELEAELLANQEMAEFLADAEVMPEARRLPIQSFIGRPATRFARYPLLLNAVIKRSLECGATESDREISLLRGSVEKIREALTEIDRRTGEGAKQLRIRQIGQRLRLVKGARESLALDSASRRLIKEGVLYAADGTSQVLIFLFDNSLIMATEERVSYAKNVTRYIADERIIPISMLDVFIPAAESGNSALLGIREALGLQPSTTALPSVGPRPALLRHASSASSMKNKSMAGGGSSTAASSTGKLALSFLHIGCRSLCRTLFVSSDQERRQWANAIQRRICIPQTLVEAYTDFRVLSDRDFLHPRGPLCSAPFTSSTSPGCQMIMFGNKEGLHLGIYGVPTSVVKVGNAAYVTRIHILRKYNIVLVLSDSNLLVYSLVAIERATAQVGNGVTGTKIASSVGFFDVGTYTGNPLVVLMKLRGSKSHFKCIQPVLNQPLYSKDGEATSDTPPRNGSSPMPVESKPADGSLPTLRVVYQGSCASLRLISEFSVPGKTKRVHFLRRKLCIVGTKSFEIVDVQQSRVLRSLPDPLDDDFSFVHNAGNHNSSSSNNTATGVNGNGAGGNNDIVSAEESSGQAMAICKVGREFLLCYESFAFYIDNFGRRSRPDIFIRWEMRPQVITFRHPYIVAINPKFLEIRHVETGVLLSIIRMKRSLCLNPDSRSVLLHMAVGPGPIGVEVSEPSPNGDLSGQSIGEASTPSIATTADASDKVEAAADSAIASATASTAVLPPYDSGTPTDAIAVPLVSKAVVPSRITTLDTNGGSSRPTSGLSASFFKSMTTAAAAMATGGIASSGGSGTDNNTATNTHSSPFPFITPVATPNVSHAVPGLAGTSGKKMFPEGTPSHYRIIEIRLPLLKASSSSSSSSLPKKQHHDVVDASAVTC
ncbi:RHO1 GDP-GTP exchange protein 2, partial [Coemansia sp. RSA 1933]